MPETVEILVYRLGELSAPARDRARAWYRERALDPDWHESVFDDFGAICAILGVTLVTTPIPLMGGGTRPRPHIYFSGFCNQGDGASFEGLYGYRSGCATLIRQHAPTDTALHRIADALQAFQRRHFYGLRADVRHRGRYVHELTMAISVERASGEAAPAKDADIVIEALLDLARWLYRQLEREHDYQTSDAVIDEAIAVNGWTFTEDGRRFS